LTQISRRPGVQRYLHSA